VSNCRFTRVKGFSAIKREYWRGSIRRGELIVLKKYPGTGKPWKIVLATLVCLFLVGMSASLIVAAKRVSRVVDPDYYSHGLHYGETHQGGR
jgi:hypothetical protein